MAMDQNRRLRPKMLQADRETLVAVQSMPDYTPLNDEYSASKLSDAYTQMQSARVAEIMAQNALNAARDAAIEAEWQFHNAVLAAKDQVIAQYGADSNQVQALGLKKKSDRKRRSRPRIAALPE
jgi:hypothetical protein